MIVEHSAPVLARVAVQRCFCLTCGKAAGVPCVNATMTKDVPPHQSRLNMAAFWFTGYDMASATVLRQKAEIEGLKQSLYEAVTARDTAISERDLAEREATDLHDTLAEALSDNEALRVDNARLQKALDDANGVVSALRVKITELEAKIPAPTPAPVPTSRVLVGASYNSNLSGTDGVEAAAGTKYDIVRIYARDASPTQRNLMVTTIRKAAADGRTDVMVSFKPPASWADMAAGKQDAWIRDTAKAMSDVAVETGVNIWLIISHEPENDGSPNNGFTAGGRDAWKASQSRYGQLIKGKYPRVTFGPCLMGYHSQPKTTHYDLWQFEKCIPAVDVDFVMIDPYEDSSNVPSMIKLLADYCEPRGLKHGLAETGVKKADFATHTTFFTEVEAAAKAVGTAVVAYFNTDANSTSNPNFETSFAMEQGGPRFKAWVALVKRKTIS